MSGPPTHQGASPLDPCEHLTHETVLPTIQNGMTPMHKRAQRGPGGVGGLRPLPPFLMTVGGNEPLGEFGIGGSMESLMKMVALQIENSFRNYVNFTLRNGFSWAFKTLKPMSFRGLRPLDPRWHDGISDENSTNCHNSVRN